MIGDWRGKRQDSEGRKSGRRQGGDRIELQGFYRKEALLIVSR